MLEGVVAIVDYPLEPFDVDGSGGRKRSGPYARLARQTEFVNLTSGSVH